MIVRSREFVENGVPTQKVLYSAMSEFLLQPENFTRLRMLGDYYRNDGKFTKQYPEILFRTRKSGLPNNKLAHGYPRFIATMSSGYLIGDPPTYSDSEQQAALDPIMAAYRRANTDTVDAEIAKNAAIYGKGVELVYVGEGTDPQTVAVSPIEAFVVYDNTAELRPLFGVYFFAAINENGDPDGFKVFVYSDRYVFEYKVVDLGSAFLSATPSIRPHYFGGVPLNEYWNNEDETGDFESVIKLIEAYNMLESDRVNDKEQFVDALLVMIGCNLETDANGRTPGEQLREDKTVSIPGEGASIQYLSRAMTEADVDVLRAALNGDIHKLSMVPDLTDQSFAANASGVAMKYKLIGFEQLTKIKERWFREGLRDRLKLFANFMAVKGNPKLDPQSVSITFKRGLPVNELEIAQIVQTEKAGEAISTYQSVKSLHSDWSEDEINAEVERISDEQKTTDNASVRSLLGNINSDEDKPKNGGERFGGLENRGDSPPTGREQTVE